MGLSIALVIALVVLGTP
jgi:hypothetical protein